MSPRRPTPAAATHTGLSLNDRLALLAQVVCPSPGSRLTTRLPVSKRFPEPSLEYELQRPDRRKPPSPAGFSVGAAGIEPATSRV